MSGYSSLWDSIKHHVSETRNIKTQGMIDANDSLRVTHRAAQLFTLDILLQEHRKKFGRDIFPLHGKDALHHKILIKYKWPLDMIRELSLSDCLLALQDELIPENLSEGGRKFLGHVIERASQIGFDDLLDEEWNPMFAELFLREQQ
ncbi:hypothetical protein WCT80_00825 [Pectobacterium carotovorum]|uniref:ECs1072 family phage-associated protein n=1 Tax=Pectobacterium carotovorum TaxID=554 RepID=UPI00301602C9